MLNRKHTLNMVKHIFIVLHVVNVSLSNTKHILDDSEMSESQPVNSGLIPCRAFFDDVNTKTPPAKLRLFLMSGPIPMQCQTRTNM